MTDAFAFAPFRQPLLRVPRLLPRSVGIEMNERIQLGLYFGDALELRFNYFHGRQFLFANREGKARDGEVADLVRGHGWESMRTSWPRQMACSVYRIPRAVNGGFG